MPERASPEQLVLASHVDAAFRCWKPSAAQRGVAMSWSDIKQDWYEAGWTQRVLLLIALVFVVLTVLQFAGPLWRLLSGRA